MILRWAIVTSSGLAARVYAPNRLHAARTLAVSGHKLVSAREAGCWHEHVGLVLPAWDGYSLQDDRKSGMGA